MCHSAFDSSQSFKSYDVRVVEERGTPCVHGNTGETILSSLNKTNKKCNHIVIKILSNYKVKLDYTAITDVRKNRLSPTRGKLFANFSVL